VEPASLLKALRPNTGNLGVKSLKQSLTQQCVCLQAFYGCISFGFNDKKGSLLKDALTSVLSLLNPDSHKQFPNSPVLNFPEVLHKT